MSDTPKTDAAEELLYSLSWDTDVDGYDREQLDPVSAVRSEKVRELERENAALSKDKERLDWLAVTDVWFDEPATESYTPETFRAEIDRKRKEAQP